MVVAVKAARDLAPVYDAIVIGSGYGGGVSASRLARMGLNVAVIEQGRLWRAGDFPTTVRARRRATRVSGRVPRMGDQRALYSLSVGRGLTVFGATGLGGSSLINAGVTLRPNFDRLRAHGWPTEVTDDGLFEEGLGRAEHMLGVGPVLKPDRFGKYRGMKKMGAAADVPVATPSMTVTHRPGPNAAGVMQYSCRHCGDCWSGCNAGAKNTVGITYIPDAVDHGAQIFCGCRADQIAKTDDGWSVEVADTSGEVAVRRITAPLLVLAAGTLGTNELLLRAKARGLPVSDQLGQRFSANGDDLVFATELDEPVNAIATGYPPQAPRGTPPVGP
ncbi:MAG: GMC family oxidoreductase N-terminal domain-containing protein, partial [Pseudomonadota bacterium]